MENHGGYVAQGLDVVDHRGPAPGSGLAGERRLRPGVGAFPLQRIDQSRFLAADVAPRPRMHRDVEIEPAAIDIRPQPAGFAGLVNGPVQHPGGLHVFTPQKNIALPGIIGPGSEDHPLNQQMGLLLHQQPVLEGARLHFISITDQVAPGHVTPLQRQAPLDTGGKTGAAPATHIGVFDKGDDALGIALGQCPADRLITILIQVFAKPDHLAVVPQPPGQRVGFGLTLRIGLPYPAVIAQRVAST